MSLLRPSFSFQHALIGRRSVPAPALWPRLASSRGPGSDQAVNILIGGRPRAGGFGFAGPPTARASAQTRPQR
jgi:hypothetical protein